MQFFPLADTAEGFGFDQMNANPSRDMTERGNMFAEVLNQESWADNGAQSANKILGYAREGLEQAKNSVSESVESGIKTAKTMTDKGLSSGLAAMARLKAVSEAAGTLSGQNGKSVNFNLAAAKQAIQDFKSMKSSSSDSPQTLKMTLQDWAGLKKNLQDYGMDSADIDEIESRIGSKAGLSWGDFVHYLNANSDLGSTVEFSDLEKQGLSSFFAQMGFTVGESEGLLRNMSEKQYGDMFKTMASKLQSMAENGDSATIERSELESFISALRLSKNTTSQLKSMLGNSEEFSLGDLKRLMSAAKKDILIEKSSGKADDAQLAELVNNALKKALEKNSDALQSDRHGDDAAKNRIEAKAGVSKDILEGKDEQQGNQTAKPSAASKDAEKAAGTDKTLFGKMGNASKDGSETATKDGNDESAKSVFRQMTDRSAEAGQDGNKSGSELFDKGDGEQAETRSSKAWKEFLGRVKADDTTSTTKTLESVMDEALASAEGKTDAGKAATPGTRTATTGRSLFDQINNGAFKDLGQGRKQLTLQLKPEDLGSLNVVLQVRNKEVRAVIKTDNPEATRLVGEQLEAIKQTLQEQGLKVTKLDVQTSTTGNGGNMGWNGESGHNRAMQQEEAARTLTRWRNLQGEGESLAREMQNSDVRENLSQSGLHIVA